MFWSGGLCGLCAWWCGCDPLGLSARRMDILNIFPFTASVAGCGGRCFFLLKLCAGCDPSEGVGEGPKLGLGPWLLGWE